MLANDFRTRHTRQLWEQFVDGNLVNAESLPDYVHRAWTKCRDNGIDPRQTLEALTLPDDEIKQYLERYSELVVIARPVLEMILFSTNGAKFIVMLTSPEGVILDVAGDLDSLSTQENYYNRAGV